MLHSRVARLGRLVFVLLGSSLHALSVDAQPPTPDFLYVDTGRFTNEVAAFSVGPGGALTPIAGSPFPTGGMSGGSTHGRILAFSRQGAVPQARGKPLLYVLDDATPSLSGFSINPQTGRLTPLPGSPFSIKQGSYFGNGPLAATPNGRLLMAAGVDFSSMPFIEVYDVGPSGAINRVAGYSFSTFGQIRSMKASPDGRFLAASLLGGGVAMFSIGSGGSLTPVTGSPFSSPGQSTLDQSSGLDIDCGGLFVFNPLFSSDREVAVFDIDPTGGALNPITGSPFFFGGGGNSQLGLLSANDQFLFVSNLVGGSSRVVTVLNVAANGALTEIAGSPFGATGLFTPPIWQRSGMEPSSTSRWSRTRSPCSASRRAAS